LSINELIEKAIGQHGFPAPGAFIGVFMAEWAIESLGQVEKLGAIIETWLCVPDGVIATCRALHERFQYRVVDFEKVAATIYDRVSGRGFRILLDPSKTLAYPRIHEWYMRGLDHDLPKMKRYAPALEEILLARREILISTEVKVAVTAKAHGEGVLLCPLCGEPYSKMEPSCRYCAGERYYEKV
jgi:formylmethanofuran dehydrogenase subunit E